jgi:pimeloyl-ACP methyl ester carboxylesterase
MKSQFLQNGEVNLHILTSDGYGKKDAETILFLHGWPDNSRTWSKQYSYFENNYNVAAFDIRGAGKSSAPKKRSGYRISAILQDIDKVIEFLAPWTGKIHLVGHDWGSVLFWCYVSQEAAPTKVASFTALSCPHPALFYKNVFGKLFSMEYPKFLEGKEQFEKSWYILLFQTAFLPEFLLETFWRQIWDQILPLGGLENDFEYVNSSKEEIISSTLNMINLYREAFQGGTPPIPAHSIGVPICLVVPEKDFMIAKHVYEGTEDFTSVLEKYYFTANHFVHREKPDEINRLIEKFVNKYKNKIK